METGVLDGIICHLASKYLETILYTNPDIPREENSLNLKVCLSVCVYAAETYWFGYVFVHIRIAYILWICSFRYMSSKIIIISLPFPLKLLKPTSGNSLLVQWIELCASTAEGISLIPA